MHDDLALLRRYAGQRAQDAFAEIVRRHLDGVYSAALRRVGGDTHLAKDVTQQVFVALARKAAAVSRHPVLTGWLYITTRNEAANIVRSERRRKAREQEALAMRDILPDPESEADWSRLAPVLDAAIDELNEADRTAVLLRFVDRRTFPEIGATLRLSEDAARMRIDRALDKLRTLLARRGITSTSAALGVALANHVVTAAPAGLAATVTGAVVAIAPAGALSVISLLELMSTTKAIAGGVGLLVAAGIGTAIREEHALRAAEAAVVAMQRENNGFSARLRDLEHRAGAAEATAAELRSSIDEARAADQRAAKGAVPAPAALAANTAGRPSADSITAGQAFIERHPDVKQAIVNYQRAQLVPTFGTLYQARNFTPAQIEEFETWMMMDGGTIRRITGPDGQHIALPSPYMATPEKRSEAMKSVGAWLGPDGFREVMDRTRELHSRKLATQFAGALCFTSTPLTPQQASQFVRVVTETLPGPGRGWNGQFNWDALFAKTEGLLSEPQRAMLSGFHAQEQYQLALNQARRRGAPPSR